MALRILQFGIVFAIGFYLGPASSFAGGVGVTEIPLSIQLQDPHDVIVAKGQSATLQCSVESFDNQVTKIAWLHNDIEIDFNNDSKRLLQNDGRTLFLPKVVGGKRNNGVQGEYRCLASNRIGSVLSNPAKVRIGSFDRDFSTHPSNQTIIEFQPAVLFCNIHSVPVAQIQWEYNASELPHDTRYVPLPSGALLITKTHSSDAGFYRCKATNILFNKTKQSKTIQLIITSSTSTKNLVIPPKILPLDIQPNTTALVGDNATLYCAVIGWPIPTVQWLNNNSVVIGNSMILHRSNLSLNDSGNYTCMAYNANGRISQTYTLQVHQKPYFNVTPTSKKFPSARMIRLDCHALGVPEPKIYWLKNGKPLTISGRIKKQPNALVFSHTFTSDSGIYQCVAVNSAGRAWSAAQLVLQSTSIPSPPDNVQCRPFDDSRICLTWSPPDNVSVQAYTINTLIAMGSEVLGPEYVTNYTYILADKLNSSTNYTFYIRLYSNKASDSSQRVTCQTGVQGERNLKITTINETSVQLNWSNISTDVPCNGTNNNNLSYKVMWRKKWRTHLKWAECSDIFYVVTGLSPYIEYEFRIISNNYSLDNIPWSTYAITSSDSSSSSDYHKTQIDSLDNSNATDNNALIAPERLEANLISATILNLTWADGNSNSKYYTICLINLEKDEEEDKCKESISYSTNFQLSGLEGDSSYEFKVKTHSISGDTSPFSDPIKLHTPADVPSPVLDLKYKVVNESSACLRWQAPIYKHVIIKYIIFYSPDQNWPLENWYNKTVFAAATKGCWSGDDQTFSTLLADLKPDKQYTVFVRAESKIGLGKLTRPMLVSTDGVGKVDGSADDNSPELQSNVNNDQTYGIIIGVIIALLCIILCIACILVRKRCVKRRAGERASRMAATSDYHPAAHYTSEGNAVHVRFSHPCAAEVHEIEHLVADDTSPHRATVMPIHLDTKGTDGYPNGHVNGLAKNYTNGHVLNGDLRITENPRYVGRLVENSKNSRKFEGDEENSLYGEEYDEEDSNSNLKGSKFQDLHRIYENSQMDHQQPKIQCNHKLNDTNNSFKDLSSMSSLDADDGCSLNSTQVTCLDNSFITSVNHRRISPIVGPNG